MKLELGLHSPLGIVCHDKPVTLHDLGITKKQKKLLKRITRERTHFSPDERNILLALDKYLDIPLIEAVLKPSYTALKRLVQNQCTKFINNINSIPQFYQNNIELVKECLRDKTSTVDLFLKLVDLNQTIKVRKLVCQYGRLDFMKQIPLYFDACYITAEYGHLECLQYAISKRQKVKPEWKNIKDEVVFYYALKGGHIHCLEYLFQVGGQELFDSIKHDICLSAIKHGQFECLQYLCAKGCSCTTTTCAWAAEYGHVDILKYLHENECPWDEYTCWYAAEHGNVECLKYALENGCPVYKENICQWAAKNGSLECLKYLHSELGFPLNEITSLYCVGNLSCLKYVIEHGCPWHPKFMLYAYKHNFTNCIEYAKANGCPDITF
jgi:hypothetical protein